MPKLPDGLVALVPTEMIREAVPDAVVGSLKTEEIVQRIVDLDPVQQIGLPLLAFYLILAEPGPLRGILDFYVFNNVSKILQRKFSVKDFSISNRLGVGNFGYVFEGELVQVRNGNAARSRTGPARSMEDTDRFRCSSRRTKEMLPAKIGKRTEWFSNKRERILQVCGTIF